MYKIIGGDGRQYGPVNAEELRAWISSGRAGAQTMVQREGESDWKPLSQFSEFADALAAKPPPVQIPPPDAGGAPAAVDPNVMAAEALARNYQVNIGSCLGRAWDLLKSDFWPMIGVSALTVLLVGVANAAYVGMVVNGPLLGGLYWYYLKKIRRQPAVLNDAFSGFTLAFLQLFLGGLVSGLLIGVGTLACILPGIYLAVAWQLTLHLIIDKRIGFWEAMEVSRKVITKNWWMVFLFALVNGLMVFFGGVLTCGVGFFLFGPLAMLAVTFMYEDLFGAGKPATT